MTIKPSDISKYFRKLSMEDLQQIPDIGPTVAQSIYDWFHDEHNLRLLEKLEKVGIEIEVKKPEARIQKLGGKIIVVTGELDSMSREQAKVKIRELGGDFSTSVSKNTDFVVIGKNPGSKYDRAKELGVKIIGEEEFLKIIKE